MKRMGSTIGLIVLLSGCGVYSDVKLSMARDALRQECMGNFTNTCVSKTIDYNILLLEEAKSAWLAQEDEWVESLGKDAGKLWTGLVEQRTDQLVDKLESVRPGMFSRWFLGDAQPFSGKGMMEFSGQDLKEMHGALMAEFIAKGKQQGLSLTEKGVEKYAPAADTKGVESDATQADAALEAAISDVIAMEISKDGGAEYTDNRQVIYMDLNEDGQPDAVVLFTVEGQGGGNASYQSLAGFYRSGAGWVYQGHSVVSGAATDIKASTGPRVAVSTLTSGPDDPRCCPSVESVEIYTWNGRGFELKQS
ncbi:hypothetical protein KIY13_05615 [Pseudomonas lundensis]|uniref:hypothetical protein n=1 Tax=Pseudomonas lundensis TaxID=86185 RepID=UPI00069A903C|nr:hypothetical protein [Pseudomonas lundensis]QVQ78227.1 hypothetical protein KIN24_03840 [Pseudomonas lundensis]QVQ82711.1 hypothetical protein KIY13_05615 [Pseudomonas lundensis]